jgi:hypothetical protein
MRRPENREFALENIALVKVSARETRRESGNCELIMEIGHKAAEPGRRRKSGNWEGVRADVKLEIWVRT